ncbi:MAG TPA: HAMP domain-containing sensor histidine kinase [Coriobacteriia bacterium]
MTARRRIRSPLARRVGVMLFAAGVLCIAVTAIVFYALWQEQTSSTRTSELERQVAVIAAGVAVSDVVPGGPADTDGSRARLLKVEAGLIGARLAVADASGTVLYSTAGSASAASYPIDRLPRPASQIDVRSGVLDVAGTGRIVVAAVPVGFQGDGVAARYMVGVRALSDLGAADRWIAMASAAAVFVGLLAAWLLGAVLTRRVTAPLLRLTEGARGVAAGEWGRQVPVEGDDEVAELAGAFNEMSIRVADAYRAQQEFVGDVSHELRTPITSIKGFSEAIADGTVSDEAGVRRAAGIVSGEASRLAELTSTLLALSDLESGAVRVANVPVDVNALAEDLRARFSHAAAEAGVSLELSLSGTPSANPERLLQALSALVDNAVHHAAAGGRVRVSGGPAGARWAVDVDDDGPGIPDGERERVFRRFTRLDAARSEGGSGLGLAICRRLVTLMGGVVTAGSSPDLGGARFRIELAGGRRADRHST